jgi:NCS1 nucleoside transporter family
MVEQGLPVREGAYGARVAAVEPGGIEAIPQVERHGRPLDLFWTWLSPNFEFATIFVGAISIFLFGASFASAALGILVGTALGSLTHALLTARGPAAGAPQMVQSRAAFGYWGNLLPAALNTFTASIGWFLVNSVSGAFALSSLFGLAWSLSFTLIVILQVLVATLGHNLVHVFERYALVPLGLIFLVACTFIFMHAHLNQGFSASAPLAGGGDGAAFILTAAAAFGYAAGWNPYASDYSRYLPATASRFQVGLWAGLGVFVSCVLLELAGAALVTATGIATALSVSPTDLLARTMPTLVYQATLLAIALGAVAANAINIYSGALSFLTLGLHWSLRFRRAVVALVAGSLSLAIGLAFSANVGPGSRYEEFLLVIGYWIAPWLGVVLTHWWLNRRQPLATSALYDSSINPLAGILAMLIALLASVWLFADQALYAGPVPLHYPALGDLTSLVGFVAAAALYALFSALRRSMAASASKMPTAS